MALAIIGFVQKVYLFTRFCRGNSIGQNLRNKYVVKNFIYFFMYFIVLLPYYLNSFLFTLGYKMIYLDVLI